MRNVGLCVVVINRKLWLNSVFSSWRILYQRNLVGAVRRCFDMFSCNHNHGNGKTGFSLCHKIHNSSLCIQTHIARMKRIFSNPNTISSISPYLATRKSLWDVLASSTESVFLAGQHLERLYGMYNLNNGNGMAVGQLLITSIYCTVVNAAVGFFSFRIFPFNVVYCVIPIRLNYIII